LYNSITFKTPSLRGAKEEIATPAFGGLARTNQLTARNDHSVIAGMGIGFGNGGGMKGRNRDWKIKSNYFLIAEEKGGIV